jgi:hypothetical protein
MAYSNELPWWQKLADNIARIGVNIKEGLYQLLNSQNPSNSNSQSTQSQMYLTSNRTPYEIQVRPSSGINYFQEPIHPQSQWTKGDFWKGLGLILAGIGGVVGIIFGMSQIIKKVKKYEIFTMDQRPNIKDIFISKDFPPEMLERAYYMEIFKNLEKEIRNIFINAYLQRDNIQPKNKKVYGQLILRDYVDFELAFLSNKIGYPILSRNYKDFAEFHEFPTKGETQTEREQRIQERGGKRIYTEIPNRFEIEKEGWSIGSIRAIIPKFQLISPEKYVYDEDMNIEQNVRIRTDISIDDYKNNSLLIDNQILVNGAKIEPNKILFQKIVDNKINVIFIETIIDEYLGQREKFYEDLAEEVMKKIIEKYHIDLEDIKIIRKDGTTHLKDLYWRVK